MWNPYLTMEACYKDFVCVENAQVCSLLSHDPSPRNLHLSLHCWCHVDHFQNTLDANMHLLKVNVGARFSAFCACLHLQLSPVELAPGASWTASQKLVPQ